MTKIEEFQELKRHMENNIKSVQYCLGFKLDKSKNDYVRDSSNDKHSFRFSKEKHHSSAPIYLDAYYGYYGDSNVSIFNNSFYMECLTEAINSYIPEIKDLTEMIMKDKVKLALSEAKSEAESIISQAKELEI